MNSQTYVTDPVMWENFYKNMSNKTFDPYKFRKQKKIQTGRGLYGRFKGSYLIPVNPNSVEAESKSIQIKQVTPVEADANRAESELKDDNGMNKPHVKLLKRIKGRKRIKGGRKKKRVNEKTSKKRTSPKSKKKITPKKSKKRKLDHIDSVWKTVGQKKRRKL
ncbi:unnamed protein product [Mytilus coruscus]|uniref:Uncharacterized protein n=1 Tax=Mytilus coruscus TaxID=42192 RepID=A0A6J8A345_MYTCO|nr:unnamed protein product [Mytilus coruscus]